MIEAVAGGTVFLDGWVSALGWALIDAAWQGILVAALYALARFATDNARLRLAAGHLALLALAVLPVASLAWRLQMSAKMAGAMPGDAIALSAMTVAADAASSGWMGSIDAWLPWLVAAWAAGVIVHALRLVMQWRDLRGLCARSTPVDAGWQALLERLCSRIGVRARVRLLHGAEVVTPMLVGVLRPTILLPTSLLLQMPRAQVELVLVHELAHLRRLDTWFNLLQTCLDTLLFFHPAVHWISRKVREDRELCCDQLVLARGGDPMLYARTLLAMAEAHHRAHAPVPALGAAGGQLMERVQRIVAVPVVRKKSLRQGTQMPALGTLLALATLLWLLRPASDDNVLRDLGLPPLAVTGIGAAVPPLAGLRFSVADMTAIVQPLALGPLAAAPVEPLPVDIAPLASAEPVATQRIAPTSTVPLAIDVPTQWLAASTAAVAPAAAAETVIDAPSATTPPQLASADTETSHAVVQVRPDYPSHARLRGVEGFIVLSYRVDDAGRATDVQVVDAEPASTFERAARRALAQWQFEPGAGNGAEYRQLFDFRLGGGSGPGDAEAERCVVRIGSRLCRPEA